MHLQLYHLLFSLDVKELSVSKRADPLVTAACSDREPSRGATTAGRAGWGARPVVLLCGESTGTGSPGHGWRVGVALALGKAHLSLESLVCARCS